MNAVRLGYVEYLNTLPLVAGLESWSEVRLMPAVPSRLGDMLAGGEADVALASLVDLAGHEATQPLALLPVGMIGCDGPTLTVRVYSRVPLSEARELHADTDSRTSVVLAQVVMALGHGRRGVVVKPCDAGAVLERVARGGGGGGGGGGEAQGVPECLLVIGDKVVKAEQSGGEAVGRVYRHRVDLGQAWQELTGLPFVYACWMCRRREAGQAWVRSVASLLDRQRRRNQSRLDWIVDRFAAERHWSGELARHYVRECLRYEVTDRARAGAERFLREAAVLGLVPAVAPVWVNLDEPVPAQG